MPSKDDSIYVDDDDIILLDNMEINLPYLKSIDVTFLRPENFGLAKWESLFKIPDLWMKKLYKNEVYRDTESNEKPKEPENLADYQKKLLKDHLILQQHRWLEDNFSKKRTSRTHPPMDQLFDELEKCESQYESFIPRRQQEEKQYEYGDDSNSTIPLIESKQDNIYICRKHRVQTEDDIVEKALNKMRHLTPEVEACYRRLLEDEDFMNLLNCKVESYLKNKSKL